MVILKRFFLFFLILFPVFSQAERAVMEANIESNGNFENRPLEGLLTITHDKQDQIDSTSFQIEGKPLKATFVQEMAMTSGSANTIVSIYRFTLPIQTQGLYVLPAIVAKVGHQTIKTVPSSYEVRSANASPTIQAPPPSKSPQPKQVRSRPLSSPSSNFSPVIFRLEAWMQGPDPLYPGQRAKLFYRISYNRSIDLADSTLPFVHPKDFKKIGDVQIKDLQQSSLTIQEISQEIEASQPGTFHFGPSSVAGYAYQLNSFGQKAYNTQLLQADAPVVTLTVKPFPSTHRPTSFNGALGHVQADLKMLTPTAVQLGEKIELQITLSGVDNLEELHLPSLSCQPGFSGFFQLGDLPPSGEIKGESKVFQIELTPISTFVHALPSIEFSSFDPKTQSYVTKQTAPVPLTLQIPSPPPVASSSLVSNTPNWDIIWDQTSWPLSPLEIEGIVVSSQNLSLPQIQTLWILFIVPVAIFLIWLQIKWKREGELRPKPLKKKSEDFLKQALKNKNLPSIQIIGLLEKAYWWKIWEEGWAPFDQMSLESIPKHGLAGEARAFIYYLQSLRYSSQPTFSLNEVKQQAKDLFSRLISPS